MSEQIYENIKQENSALRNENAMLKEELALANQQLEWFRKQVFGRKTEQTSVVMDFGVQLSMFEKDKTEAVSAAQAVTVPEHKRRKKRTHDEWISVGSTGCLTKAFRPIWWSAPLNRSTYHF